MEIKKIQKLGFRNIENDKRSKSKFYEKYILDTKLNARVRPNDILVKARKSATIGEKSLATLGLKIWNALPQNKKAENSYV